MIYFFEILGTDPPQVKIGFSRHSPESRLGHSQAWVDVAVLCVLPNGSQDDERALHKELHATRISGERFHLTPDLRALLILMAAGFDWDTELRARLQARKSRPHVLQKKREFMARPENRAKQRQRETTPEYKETRRKNRARPEYRERERLRHVAARVADPEREREYQRAYRARNRARLLERDRAYAAKRRARVAGAL